MSDLFPVCRSKVFAYLLSGAVLTGLTGFSFRDDPLLLWGQQYLTARFDAGSMKVKKFDLQLTPDGFFRLKKTYPNGKQEYFSFNLQRLDRVDYLGNTSSGMLLLKTSHPDIIVQTYNDREGNIDSMADVLQLPLKSIEPESLDSLAAVLKKNQ